MAQTELQIGDAEEQSTDDLVCNPEKPDENIPLFSKQLERFMEIVMEGFDNLNSKIHSENSNLAENLKATSKIQAENSRWVKEIERNNKILSENLSKQFRKNEKIRSEFSSKLEVEVTKFQKDLDKLPCDTATGVLSVRNSMENVCEKVDKLLTGHIEETDGRIGRITEN